MPGCFDICRKSRREVSVPKEQEDSAPGSNGAKIRSFWDGFCPGGATGLSPGRLVFVPEGPSDRSLARSAWDIATPKGRPVGYGMILAGVHTSIQ